MLRNWDAGNDRWEIYVEDGNDPALWEYAFPDEAYAWLNDPEACLGRFTAVEQQFPFFTDRLQRFVAEGRVQVACFADNTEGRHVPVHPGFRHAVVLSPEGLEESDGEGLEKSVAFPLALPNGAPPSWENFPLVSPELRAACEQLAGLAFGGLYGFDLPVILQWAEWPDWQEMFATSDPYETRIMPPELKSGDAALWALQITHFGVVTLLRKPGHLIQTRHLEARELEGASLQDWLAAELKRGTQSQDQALAGDPSMRRR